MPIVKAGDINIEYYVEGNGPPLLLIMGLGGQASSWSERFLERLRPHFQIVRFSNRGTGLTDKPQAPYTVPMMAEDAAALLAELGIGQAHVFGVSLGGMIAQELVLHYAQRVQGLVLGCTTSGWSRGVPPAPEVVAAMMPAPGLSREEQVRKSWPVISTPEFMEREPEFLEEMLRASLENATPVDVLLRQVAAVQAFDAYERLPGIQAPTLVLHGDADRLVPIENANILAERIPNSTLRVLPGAGHVFFWEFPGEAGAAIVEFLSAVPAPA
ncbi:MAG: alpha/beta fold hydrolase [Chloroflexi bacterium]|nr:alpha/beta fold hydrolase [Chloroflexota bacterium]